MIGLGLGDAGASGGVIWSPALVPSLKAWYKPGGYSLGSWTDASGNGNAATEATGAKQPAVDTTTFGSAIPAFDGTDDELDIPAGATVNQANFAVFLRYWSDGPRIAGQAATGIIIGSGGPGYWVQGPWYFNLQGFSITSNASFYSKYGNNIVALRSSGSRVALTVNGFTDTGSALASTTLTGGQIGWTAADALAANHRYAEVLLYGADPTDADAAKILTHLAAGAAPVPPAAYSNPFVIFEGNSLTAGSNAGVTLPYPTQVLNALSSTIVAGKFAVTGNTGAAMITAAPTQVDPSYYSGRTKNVIIFWEGTNDLFFGATAATAYANLKTFCSGRKAVGYKTAVLTLLPRSDAGTPGTFEADRQTVNGNLRADAPTATGTTRVFSGATYADYLIDVAANATIGAPGAQTNTTYYATDLVHLINAGYGLIATDVLGCLALFGIT